MVLYSRWRNNKEQVVRVISYKAASYTDGSIVFVRLRQCAPHHLVHLNRHPHRTDAASPSHFEYIDRRTCPGMTWADLLLALEIAHSHVGT